MIRKKYKRAWNAIEKLDDKINLIDYSGIDLSDKRCRGQIRGLAQKVVDALKELEEIKDGDKSGF